MKNHKKTKLASSLESVLGVSCFAGILASSPITALAAEETEPSAGPRLEVIVITARRRTESLQDVPISIVAMTAENIRDMGLQEVKDLSFFSPGLSIEGGVDNNTMRFFIRGVGTATPTFGTEQGVPIYIDDIYTPLGIGGNIDMFAVDRVEILSGPQGTLYGRNSLGGAIKVYSKSFTDDTEGAINVTVGSFDQRNVSGEFRKPIIDEKLYLGLAYASIQNDGIQDNVYTNTNGWEDDKELYRIKLEGRPTENFTAKYSYERNDSKGAAKQLRVRPGTQGAHLAGEPFEFNGVLVESFFEMHSYLAEAYNNALVPAHAAGLGPEQYPLLAAGDTPFIIDSDNPHAGDEDNIFSDIVGDNKVEQESHTLTLEWNINDTSTIQYLGADRDQFNTRLFDIDGGPNAYLSGFEEFEFEAKSHELRYEFQNDQMRLAVGAFYYEEESDALQMFSQPFGFFSTNMFQQLEDATAVGDFSDITFEPLKLIQDPRGLNTGTSLVELRNNLRQETESTAIYANFGYSVNEKLRLSFGVRYTEDEKFAETPVGNNDGGALITTNTGVVPGTAHFEPAGGLGLFFDPNTGLTPLAMESFVGLGPDVAGGAVPPDPYGSVGNLESLWDETTIEFTADYSLSDDVLIYASYKEGFQGGQLVPIFVPETISTPDGDIPTNIDQVTSPILIDAVEVGFKATFNDRLRLNAAVYWYDWNDLILFQTFTVPVTTSTFQSIGIPTNSAEATTIGFEADVQYLLTDNLSLFGNVAWTDFTLDSADQVDPVTGEKVDVTDQFVDDYVAASPEWQGTIGFEYFQSLGNAGDLRWWSTASWRDKMSVNGQSSFQNAGLNLLSPSQAEENFFSDSFTNWRAGISYTYEDWRVDLTGSNLLDERRPEAVVNSIQGTFFGTLEIYNRPRTWALTVSYIF